MLRVKCPRCGSLTAYKENEFRPFCSERCKLLDFGAWAEGEYSVPAESSSLTEDDQDQIRKIAIGKTDR